MGALVRTHSTAVFSENGAGQGEGGAGLALLHEGVADARASNVLRLIGSERGECSGKWYRIDWIAVPQTQPQHVREARVISRSP